MAAKIQVDYSDHAKERLKERKITRQLASRCIFDGSLVGFDVRGRKINRIKIGARTLIVVYVDTDKGGKVVITAYWKGLFP